jgi:hypothetical protein
MVDEFHELVQGMVRKPTETFEDQQKRVWRTIQGGFERMGQNVEEMTVMTMMDVWRSWVEQWAQRFQAVQGDGEEVRHVDDLHHFWQIGVGSIMTRYTRSMMSMTTAPLNVARLLQLRAPAGLMDGMVEDEEGTETEDHASTLKGSQKQRFDLINAFWSWCGVQGAKRVKDSVFLPVYTEEGMFTHTYKRYAVWDIRQMAKDGEDPSSIRNVMWNTMTHDERWKDMWITAGRGIQGDVIHAVTESRTSPHLAFIRIDSALVAFKNVTYDALRGVLVTDMRGRCPSLYLPVSWDPTWQTNNIIHMLRTQTSAMHAIFKAQHVLGNEDLAELLQKESIEFRLRGMRKLDAALEDAEGVCAYPEEEEDAKRKGATLKEWCEGPMGKLAWVAAAEDAEWALTIPHDATRGYMVNMATGFPLSPLPETYDDGVEASAFRNGDAEGKAQWRVHEARMALWREKWVGRHCESCADLPARTNVPYMMRRGQHIMFRLNTRLKKYAEKDEMLLNAVIASDVGKVRQMLRQKLWDTVRAMPGGVIGHIGLAQWAGVWTSMPAWRLVMEAARRQNHVAAYGPNELHPDCTTTMCDDHVAQQMRMPWHHLVSASDAMGGATTGFSEHAHNCFDQGAAEASMLGAHAQYGPSNTMAVDMEDVRLWKREGEARNISITHDDPAEVQRRANDVLYSPEETDEGVRACVAWSQVAVLMRMAGDMVRSLRLFTHMHEFMEDSLQDGSRLDRVLDGKGGHRGKLVGKDTSRGMWADDETGASIATYPTEEAGPSASSSAVKRSAIDLHSFPAGVGETNEMHDAPWKLPTIPELLALEMLESHWDFISDALAWNWAYGEWRRSDVAGKNRVATMEAAWGARSAKTNVTTPLWSITGSSWGEGRGGDRGGLQAHDAGEGGMYFTGPMPWEHGSWRCRQSVARLVWGLGSHLATHKHQWTKNSPHHDELSMWLIGEGGTGKSSVLSEIIGRMWPPGSVTTFGGSEMERFVLAQLETGFTNYCPEMAERNLGISITQWKSMVSRESTTVEGKNKSGRTEDWKNALTIAGNYFSKDIRNVEGYVKGDVLRRSIYEVWNREVSEPDPTLNERLADETGPNIVVLQRMRIIRHAWFRTRQRHGKSLSARLCIPSYYRHTQQLLLLELSDPARLIQSAMTVLVFQPGSYLSKSVVDWAAQGPGVATAIKKLKGLFRMGTGILAKFGILKVICKDTTYLGNVAFHPSLESAFRSRCDSEPNSPSFDDDAKGGSRDTRSRDMEDRDAYAAQQQHPMPIPPASTAGGDGGGFFGGNGYGDIPMGELSEDVVFGEHVNQVGEVRIIKD